MRKINTWTNISVTGTTEISLWVQSAYTEGEGLISTTAASHRGATEMFFFLALGSSFVSICVHSQRLKYLPPASLQTCHVRLDEGFTSSSSTSPLSQTLLLQIGEAMLEEEAQEAEKEKMKYMDEHCPSLSIPGCMQELQVKPPPPPAGCWVERTFCSLNLCWLVCLKKCGECEASARIPQMSSNLLQALWQTSTSKFSSSGSLKSLSDSSSYQLLLLPAASLCCFLWGFIWITESFKMFILLYWFFFFSFTMKELLSLTLFAIQSIIVHSVCVN